MDLPLDGRQLRAFVSLARTGSLTQTAKELFLTHSAISHSMKALESDVGCRLLTTMGKKIVLTEAGDAFLPHAERLMAGMGEARAAIQSLNRWGYRELRLIAEPTFFDLFLADALAAIRKENPQLLLKVAFSNSPPLDAWRENCSLIACVQPDRIGESEFTPVLTDRLQFIVPPTHPWAASPERVQETLAKEPCVMFAQSDPLRRSVDAYFARANVTLNVVAELESIGAIKALVRRKFGIGILPLWAVKRELAEGRVASVPLGRRQLSATWGLLHRQTPLLKNVERQFISACIAKSRLIESQEVSTPPRETRSR
jgi:DNA-binding transcriptional LysR family regulator